LAFFFTEPFDWEKEMKLQGARKDDPDKIATWIKEEFLRKKNSPNSFAS
jgi:hypothetical protein